MTHTNRLARTILWLAPLFAAAAAQGESFTLYVPRDTGTEPVSFEVRRPQDIPYISLKTVARSLGGSTRVLPARVQVDLHGHTAVAWINGVRVSSSQGSFTLDRPLLRAENDVLIATEDALPFFERAFLTTLHTAPPEEAGTEPDAAEAADLDELESALLAEPIAAPADAGRAAPTAAEVTVGQIGKPPAESTKPREPAAPPAAPAPIAPPEPAPRAPEAIGTVIIDAGHGGNDPGYTGQSGLAEKELALAVAQALRRHLKENTGLKVFLTREDDRDRTIAQRIARTAEVEADLLISIHGGVSFSPRAHGFEVFYAPDPPAAPRKGGIRFSSSRGASRRTGAQSRFIGEAVAEAMAAAASAESRGVKAAPVRLLQQVAVPALLIEAGFLTNPAEEGLLATDNYRMALAEGIANGIASVAGGGEAAP